MPSEQANSDKFVSCIKDNTELKQTGKVSCKVTTTVLFWSPELKNNG